MRHKIQIKRLTELKYMLDNHEKLFKHVFFDMEHWEISKEELLLSTTGEVRKRIEDCQTASCALGSACQHAPFQKEGLRLVSWSPEYKSPDGETRWRQYSAGSVFFGITYAESKFLFEPDTYYFKNWFKDMAKVDNEYKVCGILMKGFKLPRVEVVTTEHVAQRVQILIDLYNYMYENK